MHLIPSFKDLTFNKTTEKGNYSTTEKKVGDCNNLQYVDCSRDKKLPDNNEN